MTGARVACVQLASRDGENAAARMDCIRALLRDTRPDLVLLPELWSVGFFQFHRYAEHAEPLDGPTLRAVGELARDLGAHVHGGSIVERREDGRLSNTSLLVGPGGELLLAYRKRHLFGYRSSEADLLAPGEEAGVAETPFGRVGMTTCYDLRFPELYLELVAQGAELVLVASAWPHTRLDHWRLLARARALENLVYLVACNAAGTDAGVRLAGHSVVVDPWGKILAEADGDESVLVSELDPGLVKEVRAEFPVLDDRLERAGVQTA